MLKKAYHWILIAIFFYSCQPALIIKGPKYDYAGMNEQTIEVHKKVEAFLFYGYQQQFSFKIHPSTRIENVNYSEDEKRIDVWLSEPFSTIAFREETVSEIYSELRKYLGEDYQNYSIQINTLDRPLKELIPNYYRSNVMNWDISRISTSDYRPESIIRRLDSYIPTLGLNNKNIALWHSHGWYYNDSEDRWMWQRARLFGTVEDLHPLSFTIPYLIPMLENSGANVFIPRERDTQIHEVIIDNDSENDVQKNYYNELVFTNDSRWLKGETPGFLYGPLPYPVNYNPFNKGSYVFTTSDTMQTSSVEWIPQIPEDGYYSVSISYSAHSQNADDALYTVIHTGDTTQFLVNQKIGGETWYFLGTFHFKKGYNPQTGKIILSNKSAIAGLRITADAVKIGGGMGVVERNGQTSGRPRFVEGARYWMQTSGFPDTLVYNLNEKDDYRDDYRSRGEWVNYLNGPPSGPTKNRNLGLNIPVDASLAFHTDAGKTNNDTTIGTLQIYSIPDMQQNKVFPGGISRLANRDLSDLMQSQIVNDIRSLFDPYWTRRMLWEAGYSESTRPNVPSTLLELHSHQNFSDMQFALDPRFRFHASRAIYKSLLRFITTQNNEHYIVQPLQVNHFSSEFDSSGNIILNWQPVEDILEPSAAAKNYKLYTSMDNNGFDNGVVVNDTFYTFINPKAGTIYSFKITALNDGGESFPSEILSVCFIENTNPTVMIINGFNRIAPPASLKAGDYTGFLFDEDNGVPDRYNYHFTGEQFNFDQLNNWHSDDRPGHGASYANMETQVVAGNTFNFPFVHGQAIKSAGFSFVSSSDEAIMNKKVNLNKYDIVDFILGEEKETGWQRSLFDSTRGTEFKTFPEKMKRAIRSYLSEGKSLFISGAYLGTDLFKERKYYPDRHFAHNILKFKWITDKAVKTGDVFTPVNSIIKFPDILTFNTNYSSKIYRVESPDAIGPINGSFTILRYAENHMSSAVAFSGEYKLINFGFPFETILDEENRNTVMQKILEFFNKQE